MSNFEVIELYAKDNGIPIVEKEGLDVLLEYVNLVKPKNILEVGTAIGYSALKMNSVCDSNIITFEREPDLVKVALNNIQAFDKDDKIEVISQDFLEYDLGNNKYDFIYIDGAKAQYYNFFKKVEQNIGKDTVVLFDNLDFHDFVYNESKKEQASKSLKQMIRKLEKFLEKIVLEEDYEFNYIKKGDGIGILKRKANE